MDTDLVLWNEPKLQYTTSYLENFLINQNTPQAYVFVGSFFSFAAELAKEFAIKLLDLKNSHSDEVVHQNHIDIHMHDLQEQSSVDEVRQTLKMGALFPALAHRKVIIFKNSHTASLNVLNALLKTLEEPSPHTIYILLSHNQLIPTIMSRCQLVRVPDTASRDINRESVLNQKTTDSIKSMKDVLQVGSGTAEKIIYATSVLADLDNNDLRNLLLYWVKELRGNLVRQPADYTKAQAAVTALSSLEKNFNKKMVLHKFILSQ